MSSPNTIRNFWFAEQENGTVFFLPFLTVIMVCLENHPGSKETLSTAGIKAGCLDHVVEAGGVTAVVA